MRQRGQGKIADIVVGCQERIIARITNRQRLVPGGAKMDIKSTMPLPDEVIERIAGEEGLRFRLREEFEREKKDASDSKLMKFLNSAFGLLLITSLFVTGLGSLFAWWNQRAKETESRLPMERKLMAEFDFRLYAVDVGFHKSPKPATLKEKVCTQFLSKERLVVISFRRLFLSLGMRIGQESLVN